VSSHFVAAWGLAGLLTVMGLLTAPLERRIYGSECGPRRKLMAYGITIAVLWTLALAAIRICGWTPLLHSPAAPEAWLPAAPITAPVIGVLTGVYLFVALLPLFQSLRGPRWRGAYAAAIRRGFSTLPGLLPGAGAERAAFILVSLSAGVCEEILFRGFLIRLLHGGALAFPLLGALAASSLIFGLGHAYQGFKGVLSTAVAGLFLGLLFLLSGALIPAMALHALLDLQVVYVLWPASTKALTRQGNRREADSFEDGGSGDLSRSFGP
jgi:membrane protease YdiL (CAAX protease family)